MLLRLDGSVREGERKRERTILESDCVLSILRLEGARQAPSRVHCA